MANEKHLALLQRGMDVWNAWRKENPEMKPDLSGADLRRADLHRADLSGATLYQADLSGIGGFRVTVLTGADLREADLRKANLSEGFLVRANLSSAALSGATLYRTKLSETIFGDTDLTGAKGLDSCVHLGPSTIDHRTLMKSGRLPLDFLRGCGLPDTLINYLPSLNEPQCYSCFISHSSKDEEFAKRLHADLQDKGVRCWFAPEDLKIGDKFRVRIDETIRIYDKLLLILSAHSITSEWVEKEVEAAMEKEREQKRTMLFPVRLDDAVMESKVGWAADILRTRHIGDFSRWKEHDVYQQTFARLLRDLKDEAEKEARTTSQQAKVTS